MKILVIYDGTLQGKRSLLYGLGKVRAAAGELTVLHTFDPSAFIGYDAVPGAGDMARREAAGQLEAAKQVIAEQAASVPVTIISSEGNAAEMARHHAAMERPDLIVAPQRFKAIVKGSPAPVVLVPGIILVPVDPSGSAADLDAITAEASALGASVQLLGIVPLHLYSRGEKEELERVRHAAAAAVAKLKAGLSGRGVAVADAVRAGYPDEEILAAANEFGASLVLLPSGGSTPSELSKAAAILQDEPERMKLWLIVLPEPQVS